MTNINLVLFLETISLFGTFFLKSIFAINYIFKHFLRDPNRILTHIGILVQNRLQKRNQKFKKVPKSGKRPKKCGKMVKL